MNPNANKHIYPQPATIMVRNPNNPMETAPVMVQAGGLTLREYYAGLVMQALITEDCLRHEHHVTADAVMFADALIAKLYPDEPEPVLN